MTIGLAEATSFSKAFTEINRTEHPVTVLKNNRPWVVIEPATAATTVDREAVDVAIDFMDEYSGVFEELAK